MQKISFIFILVLVFNSCQKKEYIYNSGHIFGTFYHIQYESNKDYKADIKSVLHEINKSLSTFDTASVISKINKNIPHHIDSHFSTVFQTGQSISKLTKGAFDMTVSPLVNAWGFGFETTQFPDSNFIDSIMQYVGFQNIKSSKKKIIKESPHIQLDASAIAKGYGVDMVANLLESHKINNYLVEIGGEIRLRGKNKNHKQWNVGIDIPKESPVRLTQDIQEVITIGTGAIATSGNYRQYYYENGQKYAHTIDPKTGYPVKHNLLSATIVAKDCITADALATATMVMGLEKTKQLANKLKEVSFYLIYSKDSVSNEVWFSNSFKRYLKTK